MPPDPDSPHPVAAPECPACGHRVFEPHAAGCPADPDPDGLTAPPPTPTRPLIEGQWGTLTFADGSSRPFGGTTARDVIARTLAERDGWAEIRPTHWAHAGALVKALRAAGFPLRRRPGARA